MPGPVYRTAGPRPDLSWNSGNAYNRNDVVSFLNGSYMALTYIPPGAQSPAVDVTRWMVLSNGGGEIAGPAEVTANFVVPLNAAVLQDVTGMSLAIPAGSPAYEVTADVPMVQVVFGAAAGTATQATLRLFLVDEGNVVLSQSIVRVISGANSAAIWQQARVSRRMPATAAAKTVKLSTWLDTVTNITSITLWAAAGTGTPPGTGTVGPLSMAARAR